MQIADLRAAIDKIEPFLPRTSELETAIGVGVGFGTARYGSQKHHWQDWLDGYLLRREGANSAKTAGDIYNRLMCPPMLFWLAEGARVPSDNLDRAFSAVVDAEPLPACRCSALRRVISWPAVATAVWSIVDQSAIWTGAENVGARSFQ